MVPGKGDEPMEHITIDGKEYLELYLPSVAEAYGLRPRGSTPPALFPIIGYEKDGSGNPVPM